MPNLDPIPNHGIKSVSLENDRIEIRFAYSKGLVDEVKKIPDAMWDNDAKCWHFRPSVFYAEKAIEFAMKYQFYVGDGIWKLKSGSTKRNSSLREKLYDFQREDVDVITRNYGTCLVANEMGTGKSIEAIAYAVEQGLQSVLVICPASVLYKWQDEFAKWSGWDSQILKTGKTKWEDTRVHIVSYAMMLNRVYELRDKQFDMLIVDECHAITNPKAKRAIAFEMLQGKRKLFLSGTPFLNRPIELYNILHQINPLKWKSYWAFANKYAGAHRKDVWTKGGKRQVWDVSGATNLDELKETIDHILIRRKKADVLKDLPELTRTKVRIDITNKREYNTARIDFKKWLTINGKESASANALSKLNSLRKIVGEGKVDAAVELAEEALLDTDRKVVLFAHHKDVVNALKDRLKDYGVGTIVGDDSNQKRADTVKKFQDTPLPRVLVISSAGGEGIDLYRADTIIVVERQWNGSKETQAEARLHRNGQKNAVQVYYLVAVGTIDEQIDELIEHKQDIFDEVIGTTEIQTEIINRLKGM